MLTTDRPRGCGGGPDEVGGAQGPAELTEGFDQPFGFGEQPFRPVRGGVGQPDRGGWVRRLCHRRPDAVAFARTCQGLVQDREPELGMDRIAAPLLVVEEGDLGLLEGEEVALDRPGRAPQLAGERRQIPAAVPLLDQAEHEQQASRRWTCRERRSASERRFAMTAHRPSGFARDVLPSSCRVPPATRRIYRPMTHQAEYGPMTRHDWAQAG